ncbi:hypothetical protein D9M68_607160 [compost metagenome]
MALMLTMRGNVFGQPGSKSGRCSAASLIGKKPEVDNCSPPAAWRHAPTSDGRHATARTAWPPPCTRCMP